MPRGIYKRTKLCKKRMSLSKRGNKNPMWGKTPNKKQMMCLKKGQKVLKGKDYLQKLRKRMKGNKFGFKKGHTPWNIGKHHSMETRKKMVESHKGKVHSKETRIKMGNAHRGKKSFFWKGGITPKHLIVRTSLEFKLWREAIFERDDYICQKCGRRSKKGDNVKLHPHHIKNFAQWPKLRFAIDNGITFCKKCHDKFHKIYGRKNNNKVQVEKFLKKDKPTERWYSKVG